MNSPRAQMKCLHCDKLRGDHKTPTLQCPVGMKTRVGYTRFHEFTWFAVTLDEVWSQRWSGVWICIRALGAGRSAIAPYLDGDLFAEPDEDTCTCIREQLLCCPPEMP